MSFLNYFHCIYNLGDDQTEEVKGETLVIVFLDQIVNWNWKKFENDAEMVSEDKEVKHPDQWVLPIRIVHSVQLRSYFGKVNVPSPEF